MIFKGIILDQINDQVIKDITESIDIKLIMDIINYDRYYFLQMDKQEAEIIAGALHNRGSSNSISQSDDREQAGKFAKYMFKSLGYEIDISPEDKHKFFGFMINDEFITLELGTDGFNLLMTTLGACRLSSNPAVLVAGLIGKHIYDKYTKIME